MQLGTRDILLAHQLRPNCRQATQYFAARKASALEIPGRTVEAVARQPKIAQRVAKLSELAEAFDKGKDQFLAVRKQVIEIESKRAGREPSVDDDRAACQARR